MLTLDSANISATNTPSLSISDSKAMLSSPSSISISFSPRLFPVQSTSRFQLHPFSNSSKHEKLFQGTKNSSCFRSSWTPFCVCSPFSSLRDPSTIHDEPGVDLASSSDGPFVGRSSLTSGEVGLWLQSCRDVDEIREIHAVVLRCMERCATFVGNNLISAYVRLGSLAEARNVFDGMPERNVVSWTAIINGYLKFKLDAEALRLFKEFVDSGVRPNPKTFVCVLNLCSRRPDFELGKQVHACIIKGKYNNLIVDSAVLHFYANCGDILDAFRVFDLMAMRDVVCWTTMITACSTHRVGEEAFSLFSRMLSDGFIPNEFTICSVLDACGDEMELKLGRQLHGAIVKKLCRNDVFLGSSLVDMYAKCGEIMDSRTVFDGLEKRNTVTWTSIIAGYARNGLGEEAISLFRVMIRRKICSTDLTMVSVLRACGLIRALPIGKEVHAQIVRKLTHGNSYLESTLVWLYCKCGEYTRGSKVLQGMCRRDVVSWTAMISGCACLGHEYEALEFMKQMMGEGVGANPFTYSSALKACARLENIWQGKSIHSIINKTQASSNLFVGTALINMYTKCGYVSDAVQVFDRMPERNLVSWKAMIVGYAKNGRCKEALKLMYRMQAEGIQIDDYVYSTVLTACDEREWSSLPLTEPFVQSN